MAGYDFEFRTKVIYQAETRELLRVFRALAKRGAVDVRIRTKIDNDVVVYMANVDDHLEGMQMLEKEMREIVEYKFGFEWLAGHKRKAMLFLKEVAEPMLAANSEGVDRMAEALELVETLDLWSDGEVTGAVATKSVRLLMKMAGNQSLKKVVTTWDKAREATNMEGTYINGESVLLDQALETYLKSCITAPKYARHRQITEEAVEADVITGAEKDYLDKFHEDVRNPAQHEDRVVSQEELYDFVSFMSTLLTKWCKKVTQGQY